MFSLMGDRSTDRKTIEQEIIYVRLPVGCEDMSKSLAGLRYSMEFFDLVEVDPAYSLDGKSFDSKCRCGRLG